MVTLDKAKEFIRSIESEEVTPPASVPGTPEASPRDSFDLQAPALLAPQPITPAASPLVPKRRRGVVFQNPKLLQPGYSPPPSGEVPEVPGISHW